MIKLNIQNHSNDDVFYNVKDNVYMKGFAIVNKNVSNNVYVDVLDNVWANVHNNVYNNYRSNLRNHIKLK